MANAELIWMNGKLVPWADAHVHVTTHALHYGSSVFEGVRAYATAKGPAVFRLHDHTKRLLNSCKIARLDITYSADEIDRAVLETVARNAHEACYIRPLVFRGAGPPGLEGRKSCPVDFIIYTYELGRYLGGDSFEQGIDVQVSSWRRIAPDTFASLAKIGGQYVNSQFITMEAHDNGFQEGVGLDINGYVSEGAGENLFAVVNGTVYTPGAWSSILLGITRDSVLTILREMGVEVRFEPLPRDMLYLADELFFTGTAAEITPIRSVDRLPVGTGRPGPITRAVQEAFFGIVSGQKPDQHNWLTYVSQYQTAHGD